MEPRALSITRAESGQQLAAVVRQTLHCSWSVARRLVSEGKVQLNGKPCREPGRVLRVGHRLTFPPKPISPTVAKKGKGKSAGPKLEQGRQHAAEKNVPKPILRYGDKDILVVEKPAGLTTVRHADETKKFGSRARRFLPPTLADLLPGLLEKEKSGRPDRIRAVHRLDRETSGLLVFARTEAAERHLGQQMRAHSAGRKYLALVRGHPQTQTIESFLIEDRGDGRRGSTNKPGEGKHAVTHVTVLEQLGPFALVECQLETGRTHQVRIHLGERGFPLCGEQIYDRPCHGSPVPDASGATRLMLHAGFLEIEHPATRKRLSWAAPLPPDMKALLKKLRRL